jgi:hypothetical protein
MSSEPDFDKNKFDAAKQIKDTPSVYNYIGYDDYQYKDLWIIAYNAFCDQLGYPRVKWDTTTNEVTKAEKAMIKAIFGPSNKIKDKDKKLCADAGFDMPENPVYDREDEEDFDPDDFVIEEFGDYAFNFFVDMENGNGLVQNFDNMVYVCNLEPNSMTISTTIVPEGMLNVTRYPEGRPIPGSLYDLSKLEVKDKYSMFLGGNQPLCIIENENSDGGKLLVIRDSYCDSLAPFLGLDYSEVHLWDLRYNRTSLKTYIAENGIDQVLVLYSNSNFATDGNLPLLGM